MMSVNYKADSDIDYINYLWFNINNAYGCVVMASFEIMPFIPQHPTGLSDDRYM